MDYKMKQITEGSYLTVHVTIVGCQIQGQKNVKEKTILDHVQMTARKSEKDNTHTQRPYANNPNKHAVQHLSVTCTGLIPLLAPS
eukprot:767937-Hanusia_phi.AAC.8